MAAYFAKPLNGQLPSAFCNVAALLEIEGHKACPLQPSHPLDGSPEAQALWRSMSLWQRASVLLEKVRPAAAAPDPVAPNDSGQPRLFLSKANRWAVENDDRIASISLIEPNKNLEKFSTFTVR